MKNKQRCTAMISQSYAMNWIDGLNKRIEELKKKNQQLQQVLNETLEKLYFGGK